MGRIRRQARFEEKPNLEKMAPKTTQFENRVASAAGLEVVFLWRQLGKCWRHVTKWPFTVLRPGPCMGRAWGDRGAPERVDGD